MWVDEGEGRVAEMMAVAHAVLDQAPAAGGHQRAGVDAVPGSVKPRGRGSPAAPTAPGWWCGPSGSPTRVRSSRAALGPKLAEGRSVTVSGDLTDLFRPTALITGDGGPWVFFGRRDGRDVGVWASRWTDGGWTAHEQVSDGAHPALNQEAVPLPGGGLEVCWQGRHHDWFAIFARRWSGREGWGATVQVSSGVEASVWDPSVSCFADGGIAYAWSEYVDGAYRVVVRRRDAAGVLAAPQNFTSDSDYALHPHLAVTRDQQLWCAFDFTSVAAHGGSGPHPAAADGRGGQ